MFPSRNNVLFSIAATSNFPAREYLSFKAAWRFKLKSGVPFQRRWTNWGLLSLSFSVAHRAVFSCGRRLLMFQNVGRNNQVPTFRNMPTTARLAQRDLALDLLARHGTLRLSDLKSHGVHPPTLARLVEEGVLHQPSRGLYEIVGAATDLNHSFAEVGSRAPKAVICLVSALQFHEITLQNARSVWIAIGSKDRKPAIEYPPTRVMRFGPMGLSLGVETHHIDSVPVKIFDPAKSIGDCFRFRNKVGIDVALEALRLGWRSSKASPEKVAAYSWKLRIWTVICSYLESVVADEG